MSKSAAIFHKLLASCVQRAVVYCHSVGGSQHTCRILELSLAQTIAPFSIDDFLKFLVDADIKFVHHPGEFLDVIIDLSIVDLPIEVKDSPPAQISQPRAVKCNPPRARYERLRREWEACQLMTVHPMPFESWLADRLNGTEEE